jgi:hypothetical protein
MKVLERKATHVLCSDETLLRFCKYGTGCTGCVSCKTYSFPWITTLVHVGTFERPDSSPCNRNIRAILGKDEAATNTRAGHNQNGHLGDL